jgi:probable phosphoglycerate mutase
VHRLVVVRHAQSEWNAVGRWQGRADPPLSDHGRAQARRAGAALGRAVVDGQAPGPLRSVWSSDLRRACDTAALLASAAGGPGEVREVPSLGEHDVGEWSGLNRAEIEQRWPGLLAAWSQGRLPATPGGEPRAAFDERVRRGLREVVTEVAALPVPDGLHLVVTHGGVLRSMDRWLGRDERGVSQLEGMLLALDDRSPVGDLGAVRYERPVALLRGWQESPAPAPAGWGRDQTE